MLNGKRIAMVMPGYNCSRTLEQTLQAGPNEIVDDVIYVDDCSTDDSVAVAERLGIPCIIRHEQNGGYGANQKTCYWAALKRGADVVVMVHPDYQYDPRLVTSMVSPIVFGVYDCMLASRILGGGALKGGMPLYKYIANRALTFSQNLAQGSKLSEFHTGYRAFSRDALLSLPLAHNSNDFAFDNHMLAQILFYGLAVGEVSCPTKYFPEASSINFRRSCKYGLECLETAAHFRLAKTGILPSAIFPTHVSDDATLKPELLLGEASHIPMELVRWERESKPSAASNKA